MATSSVLRYGNAIFGELSVAYAQEVPAWFGKHHFWVMHRSALDATQYFRRYVLPILKRPHHPYHKDIIYMWMILYRNRENFERAQMAQYEKMKKRVLVRERSHKYVVRFSQFPHLVEEAGEDESDDRFDYFAYFKSMYRYNRSLEYKLQRKEKKIDYLLSLPVEAKEEPFELIRNPKLLHKLRLRIQAFRMKVNCDCDWCLPISKAEMGKEDAHNVSPDASVKEHHSGNVCLQDQREDSEAVVQDTKIPSSISAGDNKHSYDDLMGRWLQFNEAVWSTDDSQGKDLHGYHHPAHVVSQRGDSPNVLPFSLFQYWKGDLEFRVVVNSNRFMTGQLQVSWLYDPLADKNFNARNNVFTLSQAPHVLVNAGSSNSAVLKVGYRNPLPYLPTTMPLETKQTIMFEPCLNLGSLYVKVLVPLRSTSSGNVKCSVSLFVRFLNNEFVGMKNRDVGNYVYPEMLSLMAAKAAERVLDRVLPDVNQDRPIDPTARLPMSPQAVQSICAGTNIVHPSNALRLNPLAQTPHPQRKTDEMIIKDIAGVFGLVKQIKWSMNEESKNTHGYELARMDASPMWKLDQYHAITYKGNTCYALPPVAVVSSMFAYWRGCLQMRLDFVASFAHTGRLLIAYIPRCYNKITYKQALGSPHMVFDLQESQSITFTIPYITNQYGWGRRVGIDIENGDVRPPGTVYIFVMNGLISMDAVPKEVEINVYWRAAEDFEFMVPAQPCVGLPYWIVNTTTTVEAKDGYYPWYWGTWEDLEGNTRVIARYGPVLNHIAQFQNMSIKKYYTLQTGSNVPAYVNTDGAEVAATGWFVAVDVGDGWGAVYMSMVENEIKAKEYISQPNRDLLIKAKPSDDSAPYTKNPVNPIFLASSSLEDYLYESSSSEIGEGPRTVSFGEGQEMENICQLLPCADIDVSRQIFGERFDSFKDLCRRYQPYGHFTGVVSKTLGDVMARVPILPQGLDVNVNASATVGGNYANFVRDGVIPIIASGYRHWRGGISITAIINSDAPVAVWFQHRPDLYLASMSTQYTPQSADADCMVNTGYAAHVMSTGVNNTCHIECPYYQPFAFSLLQRGDMRRNYVQRQTTNGTLYIGAESMGNIMLNKDDKAKNIPARYSASLLYSLADDAHFETFQGFPPMSVLAKSKAQMGIGDSIKQACASMKDGVNVSVTHKLDMGDVNSSVQAILGKDNGMSQEDKIQNYLSNISDGTLAIGSSVISSIGHVLMNPSLKSIAWTAATLLCQLGLFAYSALSKVIEVFQKFLRWLGYVGEQSHQPLSQDQPSTSGVQPSKSEMDSEEIISVVNVGFTVINQLAGIAVKPPKDIKSFGKVLVKDLRDNIRTSNFFFTFLRNNFKLFSKIGNYVSAIFMRDRLIDKMTAQELPGILDWCDEVDTLLDVVNDEKTFAMDSSWANRLEYAYCLGQKLNHHFIEHCKQHTDASAAYKEFVNLFKQLKMKRTNMHKRGFGSVSRREPFCVWMFGSAGIGKSQFLQTMAPEMLSSQSIAYEGEAVFTLPSGASFWNGCRHQPCTLIDDFANYNSGPLLETVFRDFTSLKSPACLNPPQAALEDKEARYAPELLLVSSNYSFPNIPAAHSDAIYRRREVLVEVALLQVFSDAGIKILTQENYDEFVKIMKNNNLDKSKFEHLRFRLAKCVSSPTTEYGPWMNKTEFMADLYKKFGNYRQNQLELYDTRMKMYEQTLSVDNDITSLSVRSKFYKRMCDFLTHTCPLEDGSFKNYLALAQAYASGKHMSVENIKTMVKIYNDWAMTFDSEAEIFLDENEKDATKLSELMVANSKCVHSNITKDWGYVAPSEGKESYYWRNVSGILEKIPEKQCEGACVWKIRSNYIKFLVMFKADIPDTVEGILPKDCKTMLNKEDVVPIVKNKSCGFRNAISSFYKKVKDFAKNFWSHYCLPGLKFFWRIIKWTSPLLAIIAATYGYMYYKGDYDLRHASNGAMGSAFFSAASFVPVAATAAAMKGDYETVPSTESHSSGDMKEAKSKMAPNKIPIDKFVRAGTSNAESAHINQQIEAAIILIKRNTMKLEGVTTDCTIRLPARIMFIGDNFALVLKHYFVAWKMAGIKKIRLSGFGNSEFTPRLYTIDDLEIVTSEGHDLCVVVFPCIPFFRNLKGLIGNVSTHEYPSHEGIIVEVKSEATLVYDVILETNAATISKFPDGTEHILKHMYSYNWAGAGRCGSIVLNPRSNRPIIGFHCAGSNVGYAEPILLESLSAFLVIQNSADVGVIPVDSKSDRLVGDYTPIGITDNGLAHSQSGETSIIPSLVHGKFFPVVTSPAPLKYGDNRVDWPDPSNKSPLNFGVMNMMKPNQPFPKVYLDNAESALLQIFKVGCVPIKKISVMTYQEVIFGIPGMEYYEGIDMHTSEGFPLSRYRPSHANDKSWLFKFDETDRGRVITGIDKHLIGIMDKKLGERLKGIKPSTIFDDCMKDARLPNEKISVAGKTRIFSVSPVDYTIQCKQYLGDFCAAFKLNRFKLHHAVGIAPDGPEWSLIARALISKGQNFITGDYSNFGPSLNLGVMERMANLILKWYEFWYLKQHGKAIEDWHRDVIKMLLMEAIRAKHCTGNFVWEASGGAPSGSPITTELNCLVNLAYILVAWQYIMRKTKYAPLHFFFSKVACYVYGDDIIMSTDDEIIQYFNNITISDFFKQYGIKFTDASKIGNISHVTSIAEATFLKRSFIPHPIWTNEWLGPLDEDQSVKEVINWIHKSPNDHVMTEIAITSANNNAYSLGPIKFLTIHNKLNDALASINSKVVLRTWDELDKIFFKNYYQDADI